MIVSNHLQLKKETVASSVNITTGTPKDEIGLIFNYDDIDRPVKYPSDTPYEYIMERVKGMYKISPTDKVVFLWDDENNREFTENDLREADRDNFTQIRVKIREEIVKVTEDLRDHLNVSEGDSLVTLISVSDRFLQLKAVRV